MPPSTLRVSKAKSQTETPSMQFLQDCRTQSKYTVAPGQSCCGRGQSPGLPSLLTMLQGEDGSGELQGVESDV